MPGFEPLPGVRVVADPDRLDQALVSVAARTTVVRIAPDEVFLAGLTCSEETFTMKAGAQRQAGRWASRC